MSDFQYMGSELEIFAHANNWKSYVQSQLRPYLIGDVLEVGAGIGGTTRALNDGTQRRWVCLEPDSAAAILRKKKPRNRFANPPALMALSVVRSYPFQVERIFV